MAKKAKPVDISKTIIKDPKICGGQAIIRGTRVTVRTILATLAEGCSIEEILISFPTLKVADIRCVIAFAALSACEDIPLTPIPLTA